ncbi:MAG: pyruvate dehydrogenase complex dihydrolipoamide acetyltransferase [Alphaproteobacteria bacterium]|jgi:pyruvate dehydrogenase E2 component (dihydrolipoamide acetyltransferase)|nr:pyruvate dehydrogenase complex dihydrolipoamide acetyltransferase [Rhodospirillaceae bacterium]MBT6509122.1 pyruvate dehydrogenase complex dihydrolipoamide acetyltransferase [Rhodospirillaceae bacterium]MBT7649019.1 pyruvate dehydrogenase complex dihydrolipoamide acetyltransferase [Rhodospirillaceae bacterium]MDG2481020.1 pyruvate dehydrogenase complex dihydrolipoamide acetyltransferase [Alphaproteobacteria bacterium]
MPIKITMPQLSPTMTDGTLARWLVKEGDAVLSGDILAEIETDKATMEVESIDEGTVGKILIAEGTDNVPVNEVIAVLLEEGEDSAALDGLSTAAPAPAAEAPEPAEAVAEATPAEPAAAPSAVPAVAEPDDDSRVKASPLARSMARQAGLSLSALSGSGPHGRIVKRDVEAALEGGVAAAPVAASRPAAVPPAPPPAGAAYEEIKVSNMRRVIAERLQEAKQTIPHFYLTVDCELDRLLALRKDLNGRSDAYKISVNDFVIRALALGLKQVTEANAQWAGDVVRRFTSVDIAVAVAIDGGLVTPVVRSAETKGLATISEEMKDLAARAREGKLIPEEYQGGGFSLSNLGMYGIKQFDGVINPPQAGILAIGAGEQRAVVKDGALDIATVMSCTVSCDHRVIDGAIGANLLTAFKGYIEDPLTMLL